MAKKILGALISPVGTLLGLASKKKDTAAPVAAPGPTVMPLADDAAVKAARKRSLIGQSQRGGRSSTILTDTASGSDKLGG